MAPKKKERINKKRLRNICNGINTIGDDILGRILTKLPAKSFAFASCVSRSWNSVSKSILSKPQLVTALSREQDPKIALEEVVNEVLSKPIRPHFVIASFTLIYNLETVHEYMQRSFGSTIPIITNMVEGVIGHDVESHELTEITMEEVSNERMEEEEEDLGEIIPLFGLALIVGWFPDLKVNAIPLLCSSLQMKMRSSGFERFIGDIKKYTMNVTDSHSPAAIIMFGDKKEAYKTRLMEKMDKEFDKSTAIVGHFNSYIDFYAPNPITRVDGNHITYAVALIFARDINKANDVGQTQFHIPSMKCVSQVGFDYSIVSITGVNKQKRRTNIIVKNKNDDNDLPNEVFHLPDEIEQVVYIDDYYIGIDRNYDRKDGASSSSTPPQSYAVSLHGFKLNNLGYDYDIPVEGENIEEGESFSLYKADFKTGLLLDGILHESAQSKSIVFGGLVFASMSRTVERMTRHPLAYSLPFVEQFEDVPLGGLFTKHIAKRNSIDFAWKDSRLQEVGECYPNRKGVSYLVMSYIPA